MRKLEGDWVKLARSTLKAFAKAYQEAYQSAWVTNRQPRAADKVRSVIKAYQLASQKQDECCNAWSRCGSNGTPAPSNHTLSSLQVTKAAAARFATCIGRGAILSAEVMLQIMADVEHEIEQKRLEEERRTAHRNSQHPTWLSLLNVAIAQQLTATGTTLNKRGVIPLMLLKSWCKKVRITQSGTQIEIANRLLCHFGLVGEVVRYVGEGENDDHDD
jgi:hypothetical protein